MKPERRTASDLSSREKERERERKEILPFLDKVKIVVAIAAPSFGAAT